MLSERLQVLISPEQRDRLEAEAAEQGISVAAVIRAAVGRMLRTRYTSVSLPTVAGPAAPTGRTRPVLSGLKRSPSTFKAARSASPPAPSGGSR